MKDLALVLSGIVIGLLISLWFVPSYLYMHPLVMVLVIVVGLTGAFALGVVAGRRTAKPPAVSLRGRVYEEPAALALVEIALKRQGGVG